MIEKTIGEIEKLANEFRKENKKWHFHMLTPDCMFNERRDIHAFVLENETDGETFVCYSKERYMDVGKRLVQLIHGEKIVSEGEQGIDDGYMKEMLAKAKSFNERGVLWHHHMLFPNCIFNKHKGKWCIVFEDKEENKIIEFVSEEEPTEQLRKIEVLYYSQKK